MNRQDIIAIGYCFECAKENVRIYVIHNWNGRIRGECFNCHDIRLRFSKRGKPPNGFKFNSILGTPWEVVDQAEDDPEIVMITSSEYEAECKTYFEWWKIWQGLEEGDYVIA